MKKQIGFEFEIKGITTAGEQFVLSGQGVDEMEWTEETDEATKETETPQAKFGLVVSNLIAEQFVYTEVGVLTVESVTVELKNIGFR